MADAEVNVDVPGYPDPVIDLAAIERELADLWRVPAVLGLHDTDVVPTRTSVLNLVIYAANADLAEQATRLISQLAANHPSRTIIFAVNNASPALEGEIQARVSAHCYASADERFAACFEQILIQTPVDALDYLPSIITPLALPDLPTFVWWPGQPPLGDRRFLRVAESTDRLIIDSLDFVHCPVNLLREATLCRRIGVDCTLTDLNWARLNHWREMTAQFFDMPETRWGLDHIRHVEINYGRANGMPANPSQALLYIAWVANRLGWHLENFQRSEGESWHFTTIDPRGHDITIHIKSQSAPQDFNGYLLSGNLFVDDGKRAERFAVARVSEDLSTLKMTAENDGELHVEHAVHAPPPELHNLLVHELERRHHDDMFEDALQEMVHFAQCLRGREKA